MDKPARSQGRLYVVATPLGNLDDITARAVEVLRACPVIACEDTRHSRKLLTRHAIESRLISCHEHNEVESAEKIVSLLEAGQDVALISDAGTPGISDPGYRVVSLAAEHGLVVSPVPGPSALAAAVSVAGLPTDRFLFAGFLPQKASALKGTFEELAPLRATLVFYCPARRLEAALRAALDTVGDRRAAICRELTKVHEEIVRGRLTELVERMVSGEVHGRGEVVLLLEGKTESDLPAAEDLAGRLNGLLDSLEDAETLGAKHLTVMAAERFSLPRNRIYPLVCAWLNRRK